MESLNNEIDKRINLIGKFYLSKYLENPQQSYISLLGGRGSSVLLQYLYFVYTTEKRFKDEMNKNVDYIIHELENSENIFFSFCDGVAGIGWLLSYLNEKKIISVKNEVFFEDIDNCLEKILGKFLSVGEYDLLHGAMGIAMYFLKRGKKRPVEEVIKSLLSTCELSNKEAKWRRYDKYISHKNIYDFGLAHGQAGILYFLGKCYKQGVQTANCKKMILGIINFYLNNAQNFNIVGSHFPSVIPCSGYNKKKEKESKSRLAWCYGDIGILHTLILVSNWLKLMKYRKVFEMMLVKASSRTNVSESLIKDAQFCHGSSGVSYLYLSAYHLTGNIIFKNASVYWFKISLNARKKGRGVEGSLFHAGKKGWVSAVDILSGLGGVAMLLLVHQNIKYMHDWDECLFIS